MADLCKFVWPHYSQIFLLSLAQEIMFWTYKAEIFNWNSQNRLRDLITITKNPIEINKNDGKEQYKHKWKNVKETYKKAPISWKIYRFTLELVGVYIGWNLIIFFINKFIQLQFRHADIGNLWNLLLVLILGLIGIAGRIPTIVDSVQEWFRR